ncbi:MAG: omega-amidase [Chthoniobacter sp.]|nr:omega-amidase [Chthoniobacter sp.]
MKICAIQLDIVWEDKRANFSRVRDLLQRSAPEPGALIVLPEMFATGFSMNLKVTRQQEAREDETFLASLAREYQAVVLGGVVSPGEGDKGRNEAVAFSPDGTLLARYTKIHPFSLGGESEGHEAGSVIATFACGGFTVAPFICYDLRFPEVFRAASQRSANLLVVMALWPVKRQQHWLTLLQARAIENQSYVVGVNRVGNEPQFSYAGRSVVIDPHGIVIADAGEREGVLTAVLEPEIAESWRRDFPALRDAHWRDG